MDGVTAYAEELPDFIRIGPFDYGLVAWSPAQARAHACYGECSNVESRISYDAHPSTKPMLLDTILHEVNHAIFFVYDIEEPICEERVVHKMATAWTGIYRDNPWFLEWAARAF